MNGFSNVKKSLRYEGYRFFKTPKFWGSILAILLVFITFMFVNYFVLLPGLDPLPTQDRQEVWDDLQDEADYYRTFMEEYKDRLTEEDIAGCKDKIAQAEFYINTKTIPSDYANDYYLAEKHSGRERLGFMFHFGTISEFVLWALCIVICSFVFVRDHSLNNYKNIYAGTTGRKAVFCAKFLFSLALCGGVWLLFFAISLAFGLSDPWKFVTVHNGTYRAIPTTVAFLAQYVGAAVAGMVFGSLAILIGSCSKKLVFSVAFPFVVYLFAILIAFTYADLAYADPQTIETFHAYVPFVCLQLHVGTFDGAYLIKLFVHLLFAGGCLGASYKVSCTASA